MNKMGKRGSNVILVKEGFDILYFWLQITLFKRKTN